MFERVERLSDREIVILAEKFKQNKQVAGSLFEYLAVMARYEALSKKGNAEQINGADGGRRAEVTA